MKTPRPSALAARLVLAVLTNDDHAYQLAADEADECIGSWQAIAKKLARVCCTDR